MAVHEAQRPLRPLADFRLVGDDQDRLALAVELVEEVEDLVGGPAVEVARRLVGEDQGRVVEQFPPADSLVAPGSRVRLVVGRRSSARRR